MSTQLILAGELPAIFSIPASIALQNGYNRARDKVCQLDATDDLSAVNEWLKGYLDSPETFVSYRKEAIRFVLWAAHERKKTLSALTHADVLEYPRFLGNPEPARKWISPKRKLPITHPDWRPFYGPLSEASQKQAMNIINGLFNWLVGANYLHGNPLSLMRRKKQTAGKVRLHRYLLPDQVALVLDTLATSAGEGEAEFRKMARRRWAIVLLYLSGLRISEAVSNTMAGFIQRPGPAGTRQWWLVVTGKGSHEGEIPVTPELMRELAIYREAFGLSALPRSNETTPLIFSLGPSRARLTRQTLHRILKDEVFENVAGRLERADRGDEAMLLRSVSAHWLRHSLGTNLVREGMNIAQVRDVMRHANLSTTNRYVHTDEEERHSEMAEKHRLPGSNGAETT